MPNHDVRYRKDRTPVEKVTGGVVFATDSLNQMGFASWFVLLGFQETRALFLALENNFYLGSLIASVFGFFAYLFNFVFAANKNIAKIFNLSMRFFSVFLTLFAMYGPSLFAISTSSLLITGTLGLSVCLVPLTYLGKTLFFAIKNLFLDKKDIELRKHFRAKILENLAGTGFSTALVVGLVVLYFIFSLAVPPATLLWLMPVLGLGGAIVMIALQAVKLYLFRTHGKQQTVEEYQEARLKSSTEVRMTSTAAQVQQEMAIKAERSAIVVVDEADVGDVSPRQEAKVKSTSSAHFFSNSVIRQVDGTFQERVQMLKVDIVRYQEKVEDHMKSNPGSWENPKRQAKHSAADFLFDCVNHVDVIEDSSVDGPLQIRNASFNYENTHELCLEIKKHIHQHFSGAFQSMFHDKSEMELLVDKFEVLLRGRELTSPDFGRFHRR